MKENRWLVEQNFHGNFWVDVAYIFLPFSPASLAKSCLFFTLHKLDDTGGHVDPHWRLQAVQGRMGYLNTLLRNFFFHPILRFILLFVLCPKVEFLSQLGPLLKPGTLILHSIWSDEGGSPQYGYKDLIVRNPD